MRLTGLTASLAVLGTLASAAPAAAFDLFRDPSRAPERPEVIRHWVHRPHYVHVYKHGDPYKYRYARVGYYPYSGSNYWVPADQMRYRYRYHFSGPKYQYHPSWGYKNQPQAACHQGCPVK